MASLVTIRISILGLLALDSASSAAVAASSASENMASSDRLEPEGSELWYVEVDDNAGCGAEAKETPSLDSQLCVALLSESTQ